MRTEITDRFYRVYTYQAVDRVPDIEFGYWPQTIRRWVREGMPANLSEDEQNEMFPARLDRFFGFEPEGYAIDLQTDMHPRFEEEVIERRGESVIMRDTAGVVAERYENEVEKSSIPRFIRFPIETPNDWKQMKQRFDPHDPTRGIFPGDLWAARRAVQRGEMISVFCTGFYGQLRNWMGMEALSVAFYDYPDMLHDMVEHWSSLCAQQIEQIPADIPVDAVMWWEDMASKNGPLVGPKLFRTFLQPGYHRVMEAARKRGCTLSMVDCDGNPHDIVRNWLEEGVNIMFPLEVAAGVDPFAWRKEFGKELRLRGGIGKEPLVRGGKAIDQELERIKPLLELGGYIPHLDHLVPPDIPYAHYCDYLDKKRRLIGK
ncbi:MAG TPA: uroporphyrinogen decarboxylase family protein [Anaerolineae bacterium]